MTNVLAMAAAVMLSTTNEVSMTNAFVVTDNMLICGDMQLAIWEPSTKLTFIMDGKELIIDTATGKVTIPDGMEMDEAARLFWKAVEASYPYMFNSKETAQ
jgi:hypothetical protein